MLLLSCDFGILEAAKLQLKLTYPGSIYASEYWWYRCDESANAVKIASMIIYN